MSVKHIYKYYQQICDQYQEMIDNIKELEKEAEQGLIEPERIDRLKDQVAPIKLNYERWSYMIYLLHQPNKKDKQKAYCKRNKKLIQSLSSSNNLESVLSENSEALTHIGE